MKHLKEYNEIDWEDFDIQEDNDEYQIAKYKDTSDYYLVKIGSVAPAFGGSKCILYDGFTYTHCQYMETNQNTDNLRKKDIVISVYDKNDLFPHLEPMKGKGKWKEVKISELDKKLNIE